MPRQTRTQNSNRRYAGVVHRISVFHRPCDDHKPQIVNKSRQRKLRLQTADSIKDIVTVQNQLHIEAPRPKTNNCDCFDSCTKHRQGWYRCPNAWTSDFHAHSSQRSKLCQCNLAFLCLPRNISHCHRRRWQDKNLGEFLGRNFTAWGFSRHAFVMAWNN